jgi:hypothetical protein
MTCVRSGYCCRQAICPFGEWDTGLQRCKYLAGSIPGRFSCDRYDEIVAGAPGNGADLSPAFGAGCCSPLNSDRIALVQR